MGDILPAIAASGSKVVFMATLGLKSGKEADERLYKLMKEEAVREYRSVVQEKQALSPQLEQDDLSRPRYAYTQIDKTTIHKAVSAIYERAGPETKALYNLGRDPEGDPHSNWIIRWMLYHCFRYRDGRNKRPTASASQEERRWNGGQGDLATASEPVDPVALAISSAESARRSQGGNQDDGGVSGDTSPDSARGVGRPLPYDPVRA